MIDHNRINELRHMEFAKVFRGYEPKDVDAVLSQVIAEMTELLAERRGFEEKIAEFSARSGDISGKEALLGATLLKAEQMAESLRESARQESEAMIEEARRESARILDEAKNVHALSVLEMEGTRDEWLLGLSSVRLDVQKLLAGLSQLEEKWLFLDPDRSRGNGESGTDS